MNPLVVYAMDTVKILAPHSEGDARYDYRYELYTTLLEKTVPEFGAYKIEKNLKGLPRDRALLELISGKYINVDAVPTKPEWEERAIPIRVPIRKGLLGYRLFLINKKDADVFAAAKTIEDIKKLRGGLRRQWSTTTVLEEQGFKLVTNNNYEGLFQMLAYERFDYFARGVNEIFHEFDARSEKFPNMIIEETKAFMVPLPTYFFVSPKAPHLAKRLEAGLQMIISDGTFDELFWKYNRESIDRANLARRQIFMIRNPFLSEETPFDRKEYWLDLKELSTQYDD